jgi:hypothetical protein
MNAETSQKAHIALNRLTKEFTNITSVSSGSPFPATSITFTSRNYITGIPVTQSVSWAGSGNPLLLNTDTLANNVSGFSLTYYDAYDSSPGASTWLTTSKEIEITLSLVGANNTVSTFTTRVVPRNL